MASVDNGGMAAAWYVAYRKHIARRAIKTQHKTTRISRGVLLKQRMFCALRASRVAAHQQHMAANWQANNSVTAKRISIMAA